MNLRPRAATSAGLVLSVLAGCSDPLGLGDTGGGTVAVGATALRIEPQRFALGLPCISAPAQGWATFGARVFDLGPEAAGSATVAELPDPLVEVAAQPCLRGIVVLATPGRYYAVEVDAWDTQGALLRRFACGVEGGEATRAVLGRTVPVEACVPRATAAPTATPDAAAPATSVAAPDVDAGWERRSPDAGRDSGAAPVDASGRVDAAPPDAGALDGPAPDTDDGGAAGSVSLALRDAGVQALRNEPAGSDRSRL